MTTLGVLATMCTLMAIPAIPNHLYLVVALLTGAMLQAIGLPSALPVLLRWMGGFVRRKVQPAWQLVSAATVVHRPGPAARAAGALAAAALAVGVLLPVLHLFASGGGVWHTKSPDRHYVLANLDAPIDIRRSAQLLTFPDDPRTASASVILRGTCGAFKVLLQADVPCPKSPTWVYREDLRGDLPSKGISSVVSTADLRDATVTKIHTASRPWDSFDPGGPTLLLPVAAARSGAAGQYLYRVEDLHAERHLGAHLVGHDKNASWSSPMEDQNYAGQKGHGASGVLLAFLCSGCLLLAGALVLAVIAQARDASGQARAMNLVGASDRAIAGSIGSALTAPIAVGLGWSLLAASVDSAVMHALNRAATWSFGTLVVLVVGLGAVGTAAALLALLGLMRRVGM